MVNDQVLPPSGFRIRLACWARAHEPTETLCRTRLPIQKGSELWGEEVIQ